MHRKSLLPRIYLLGLIVLALNAPMLKAQTTPVTITLAATTSPAMAQPGVTVLTLVASNIPAGTITPSSLTVTLQVASGSTGPNLIAQVNAYAGIPGSGGRITFQVQGPNVTAPTPYSASVSGNTSTGVSFASSKAAAVTINPPAQILTITPASAPPGQALQVTITGQYTNYVQGATNATFGAGISVGGAALGQLGQVTVTSPTTAVAQLTLDPSAAPGPRTVTVATGIQQANLVNGFAVGTQTPIILTVNPNSGQQGQQGLGGGGSIFLTGHDPDFHAYFGGNNSPGAQHVNQAAVKFITDPAFNAFAANGIHKFLWVTSNTSPPSGHVDGTNGLIASGFVEGKDFDRVDASTLGVALGQLGTLYDALVVASDFGGILTQAELTILNARSTDIINFLNRGGGLYAMAETAPAEGGLASSGFFGFLPFVVTSTPLNEFENGNTLTPFGASLGLTNSDINGNFSHNVFTSTGGLTIVDADAGGEILSLAGRGAVSPGGVTSVLITGLNTHFTQGSTTASFGAGITVVSLIVNSATSATAILNIDPGAAVGSRNVTLTTGSEVATLTSGFTVTADTPVISQVNPNIGQQGQNLSITITGQFTHFGSGSIVTFNGIGITAGAPTAVTLTSLTLPISIAASAPLGPQTIQVVTGSESVTLANALTVTAGTPIIVSVNPPLGQQGQTLTVTITGRFTHFDASSVVTFSGSGITVISPVVSSATSITAVLALALYQVFRAV